MGSVFIKDLTDTWNSSGTTWYGIKIDVTDFTAVTNCSNYLWFCGSSGRAQVDRRGLLRTCPLIIDNANYLNGIGTFYNCPGTTIFGQQSLYRAQDINCTNYTACYNTALGYYTMIGFTTASRNSAMGAYALGSTTQPTNANSNLTHVGSGFGVACACNCYTGLGFGNYNCGELNTQVGRSAGGSAAAGAVAVGGLTNCNYNATNTNPNISFGYSANRCANSSGYNIAFGQNTNLCTATGAGEGVFIGDSAGGTNVNSQNNQYTVNIGYVAGLRNNGDSNVAIGAESDCFGAQICGCCSTYVGYKTGLKAARGNPAVNNEIAFGFCASPTTTYSYGHTVWGNSSNNVCNCVYVGWSNVSDCRDKTCIKNLPENYGLTFINKLKPTKFKWDNRETYVRECKFEYGCKDGTLKGKKFNYGFIAQDVKETIDELGISFDALRYTEESDSYRLTYTDFISPLTLAVQQLACRIDALED